MVVSRFLGSAGSAPPWHRLPKVVDDHRQPIDDHRRPIDDPSTTIGDPSTTIDDPSTTIDDPSTTTDDGHNDWRPTEKLAKSTPEASQIRVKIDAPWTWPSKTQCFSMFFHLSSHSVAERWDIFTILIKIHSFYNKMWDLQDRWVKTISFYKDYCMLKHPCFIVVFGCAKTYVIFCDFAKYWSHGRLNEWKPYIFTVVLARLRTLVKMRSENTFRLL